MSNALSGLVSRDHIKQALRSVAPGATSRAAYLKALAENEIELRLLPWLCDRRRTTVDVGAFTGTYTVGAALYSRKVIAVEPQPAQARALRRAMPDNVTVVEAALSNVTGAGVLRMATAAGGSMSHLVKASQPQGSAAESEGVEIEVRMLRLDELTADEIGFVKIEAEGHELEVLQGALRTIERDKPAFVVEAEDRFNKGAVPRLSGYLAEFGYRGYFIFRDEICELQRFDADRYQDLRLLTGGRRRDYRDYINNFIFWPAERAGHLPRTAPTARQAIGRALAAMMSAEKAAEP
jgi:FkbM family methyltransferase